MTMMWIFGFSPKYNSKQTHPHGLLLRPYFPGLRGLRMPLSVQPTPATLSQAHMNLLAIPMSPLSPELLPPVP
jgi:hypothetical protein